jgi:hypothetical protein
MVRTQIQLTEEQARDLRRVAQARGCSLAALIRQGVDIIVKSDGSPSDEEVRVRAIALAGRFRSGVKDLSKRHDDHLAEAFET